VTAMDSAKNPRLVAALGYAKRGWAVFPAWEGKKVPATRHGFKNATTDKATIVRWWTRHPAANVAIATGAISGLVVLDVDPRSGGDESLAEHERAHGSLATTLRAKTGGGGQHIFFQLPEHVVVKSGKLAPGLDVKADGGYVIASPSTHPSGGTYAWTSNPNRTPLVECPPSVGPAPRPPTKTRAAEVGADAAETVLGALFKELGLLGRPLDDGRRTVVCPWDAAHTSGSPHDSSTVIFPANSPSGTGGFYCSHAHCADRSTVHCLRELRGRGTTATKITGDAASWDADLSRTAKGELRGTFRNIVKILSHDPKYEGRIEKDEMRGIVHLQKAELTDAHISGIRVDLEQRYEIHPSDAETIRAVQFIADSNAFHPVRTYLEALRWDGVKRLDEVALSILRVRTDLPEEIQFYGLLLRRWFVGLVARALSPGCKLDTALILQGAQGVGKSTFFRVIGGDWFSDTEMALDKDALMQLRGSWVYEWAELENVFGRHAVARVKAFLTSTEDKYRPPFGRNTVSVKRSGVIVGTTNNDDFLHDPTGSRRFWVIPIGRIDTVLLQTQRDQLLAEAVTYYRAGERHWLDDPEEKQRQALADRFVETDPWDERVTEFAAAQAWVRVQDVLSQALALSLEKMGRREEMRVANILKRAGYASEQRRIDGKPTRIWVQS